MNCFKNIYSIEFLQRIDFLHAAAHQFFPECEINIGHFYGYHLAFNFFTAMPQNYPAWQAVLFTYDTPTWLTILSAIFIEAIILTIVHKEISLPISISWVLMTLTGKGPRITFNNRASASVMVTWLLGAVILCYAFKSCLIAALTKPLTEKPISTWRELLDKDYALIQPTIYKEGKLVPSHDFQDFLEVSFFIFAILFLYNRIFK